MSKTKRGLPDGFDLNIADMGPAILGDYLDEPLPLPPLPKKEAAAPISSASANGNAALKQEASPPIPPARAPSPAPTAAVVPDAFRPPTSTQLASNVVEIPSGPRRKAPRREISLNAETKRMVDELLLVVQQFSGQADATLSEVFHGIISMLYEAKEDLDLGMVPRRGQWGSVTAKAFPVALGHAFERAIVAAAKRKGIA